MTTRGDGEFDARLAALAAKYRRVGAPSDLRSRVVAAAGAPRPGVWLPVAAAAGVAAITAAAVLVLRTPDAPVAREAALPLLPSLAGLSISGARLPDSGASTALPTLPATPRPEKPATPDAHDANDSKS